jgi:hypothetical protein
LSFLFMHVDFFFLKKKGKMQGFSSWSFSYLMDLYLLSQLFVL